MRDKEAERFIRSVETIDERIQELSIKHETLMLPSAIRYDKDRVQTSPTNDTMDNTTAKLIEIEQQINKLYLERSETVDKIFHALDQLDDDRQRIVLLRYYMRHERMEKIADDLGYDLSWTYRLLRTGLRELNKFM